LDTSHLNDFLDRFKERDPELYEEAKAKSDLMVQEFVRAAERVERSAFEAPLRSATGEPTRQARRILESIAQARFRPVFVIRDNQLTPDFVGPDSAVWKDRLMSRQAVLNAIIPSVGRVEVTNNAIYDWVGTGWLVDSEVIVTNRHVASIFSQNRAGFAFKVGFPAGTQSARVDFLEEHQRSQSLEFSIESVLWIAEDSDREPDVAFLRVKRLPGGPPLPGIIPLAETANAGDIVVTIGYPARDPDIPDQDLVQQVFGDVYDKKRLAPGEVLNVFDSELEHDCSTLGGNSGSAVVRLATGEAVGLHFAGLYMEANFAVPAPKLRELVDKLRRGALPRLRPPEVSTQPPATWPPLAIAGSAFTFEANIPVKVTLEIGGAVLSGTLQGLAQPTTPVVPGPPTESTYQAALEMARQQLLGQPGIVDVRLGYRFRRGWITDERVVAVEVREKQSLPDVRDSGKQLIPTQFLGVGVDVRTAALPDQLEDLGVSLVTLEAPPPPGAYREPPDLQLERVNERMRAIFHVSPDSGLPNLRQFIRRIGSHMTATMYEWDSSHITREVIDAIEVDDRRLKMVTQREGTEDAVRKLQQELGTKFSHVWASVGSRKLIPQSYHIKVASRDDKEIWLSSGNWKDSGQPNIDPAGDNSTSISPLRNNNREWHVIIENEKLAKLFRGYIEWDFQEARRVPADEAPRVALPDVFVPEVAFQVELERRRLAVEYFDPLVIDRKLDIMPLLTPDRDSRGRRMFMEVATKLIEQAEHTIDLENQSFALLDDNHPPFERFFTVLQQKQKDGKRVRIIFRDGREFPNGKVKQQRLLDRLKDFKFDMDNIKVQVGCHTKAIVVDADHPDQTAVLFGSHNLTNTGALHNRDASLLVRDGEVAAYFSRIFAFDWDTLATQQTDELIGGVRLALPGEATPPGFRRVSLAELLGEG